MQSDFPEDYSFSYGEDRPFAPSLAGTEGMEAYDPRLLSGSLTCGTAGCHEQIVEEWQPSAHSWAAMDAGFQRIQMNMAEQNGPDSTRYCGGCHDPISLFSGTKNLFTDTEKTDVAARLPGRCFLSCLPLHSRGGREGQCRLRCCPAGTLPVRNRVRGNTRWNGNASCAIF